MSHPFWFAVSAMDWDDPLFSDEEEFLFFIDGFDREYLLSNENRLDLTRKGESRYSDNGLPRMSIRLGQANPWFLESSA